MLKPAYSRLPLEPGVLPVMSYKAGEDCGPCGTFIDLFGFVHVDVVFHSNLAKRYKTSI